MQEELNCSSTDRSNQQSNQESRSGHTVQAHPKKRRAHPKDTANPSTISLIMPSQDPSILQHTSGRNPLRVDSCEDPEGCRLSRLNVIQHPQVPIRDPSGRVWSESEDKEEATTSLRDETTSTMSSSCDSKSGSSSDSSGSGSGSETESSWDLSLPPWDQSFRRYIIRSITIPSSGISTSSSLLSDITGCTRGLSTEVFEDVALLYNGREEAEAIDVPSHNHVVVDLEESSNAVEVQQSTQKELEDLETGKGVGDGGPILLLRFHWKGKRIVLTDECHHDVLFKAAIRPVMTPVQLQELIRLSIRLATRNHRNGKRCWILGIFFFVLGLAFILYGGALPIMFPPLLQDRKLGLGVSLGSGLALITVGVLFALVGDANLPSGVLFAEDFKTLCQSISEQVPRACVRYRGQKTLQPQANKGTKNGKVVFALELSPA